MCLCPSEKILTGLSCKSIVIIVHYAPLQKGDTSLHLAAEIEKNIVHKDDEDVLIIRALMGYSANIEAANRQVSDKMPVFHTHETWLWAEL